MLRAPNVCRHYVSITVLRLYFRGIDVRCKLAPASCAVNYDTFAFHGAWMYRNSEKITIVGS